MTSTKKKPALEQAGPGKALKPKPVNTSAQASSTAYSALEPGRVAPAHFDLLMSFTNIRPGKLVEALRGFFVDQIQQKDLVTTLEVNQSMLSRKTKEVLELDGRIRLHLSTRKISALEPGKVDATHFDFLVSCTNFRGEKLLEALREHFVDGAKQKNLVATLGVHQSLLSRKTAEIHEVNERLAQISKYCR
ncbi:PapB/FocB family fimbrial expression transcriptional regulator [Pseudomonas sp. EMN2]|uniref:PapB/FocB family fimbrial expression transcriptional regulator n=1 Tax=Pseudomonas sp. EMN2 TaxID=2615212 RepID=UPI0015B3C9C3|nr:PapB/FocB family fimbrial expression transcriptional regulator [Pseudomonas sp. EMN2]